MRPHRWQPARLPRPWDSPGKNTGVGCHFLLQCMKVKSESEVTQSCPTLSDPIDCSLPGSSIHGIFQAGVLEWGAIAFSEGFTRTYRKWNSSNILLSCPFNLGHQDQSVSAPNSCISKFIPAAHYDNSSHTVFFFLSKFFYFRTDVDYRKLVKIKSSFMSYPISPIINTYLSMVHLSCFF